MRMGIQTQHIVGVIVQYLLANQIDGYYFKQKHLFDNDSLITSEVQKC